MPLQFQWDNLSGKIIDLEAERAHRPLSLERATDILKMEGKWCGQCKRDTQNCICNYDFCCSNSLNGRECDCR